MSKSLENSFLCSFAYYLTMTPHFVILVCFKFLDFPSKSPTMPNDTKVNKGRTINLLQIPNLAHPTFVKPLTPIRWSTALSPPPRLLPPTLSRPSHILPLPSDWGPVWRWLLESMIKGQYYDFPLNVFYFNTMSEKWHWVIKFKAKKCKIYHWYWLLFNFFFLESETSLYKMNST